MTTIDSIIGIAEVIFVGIIIICALKISSKRKYWTYWEQFNRSKEVLPVPAPLQMTPDNKTQAKRLWKFIVYATAILVILVVIQLNLKV